MEEIEANLAAGKSYVIRLKSDGDMSLPEDRIRRFQVEDAIRGTLDMPVNDQDTVLLKATGIPTYHFAHVVDDHLMRTTHVVRGAEWIPSLPIHVELFDKLGWEPPVYCHTAQLMKLDEEGNKRKLSKRKDPELSLDYYRNEGYHPAAVREYLLTILNSNFEEWRIANPDADIDEFEFTTEKMSNSGALLTSTSSMTSAKMFCSKSLPKSFSTSSRLGRTNSSLSWLRFLRTEHTSKKSLTSAATKKEIRVRTTSTHSRSLRISAISLMTCSKLRTNSRRKPQETCL